MSKATIEISIGAEGLVSIDVSGDDEAVCFANEMIDSAPVDFEPSIYFDDHIVKQNKSSYLH